MEAWIAAKKRLYYCDGTPSSCSGIYPDCHASYVFRIYGQPEYLIFSTIEYDYVVGNWEVMCFIYLCIPIQFHYTMNAGRY